MSRRSQGKLQLHFEPIVSKTAHVRRTCTISRLGIIGQDRKCAGKRNVFGRVGLTSHHTHASNVGKYNEASGWMPAVLMWCVWGETGDHHQYALYTPKLQLGNVGVMTDYKD